jgi:3-oxoacyl-[acyl-carrier-protein] synthase-1
MGIPPSRPEDLCIVSAGARTPVGLDAPSTSAAVSAGIAPFGEHPYMIDRFGEPMIVARDAELADDLDGAERLVSLLVPAVRQAVGGLEGKVGPDEKIPVLLALPPVRPGQEPDLSGKVLRGLLREFKGAIKESSAVPFAQGHSAGLLALEEACRRMGRGEAEICVIAGVDSYHDPETLEWLDDREQLKSEHHTWGFIPGEASAAIVLTSRRRAQKIGLPVLGTVIGAAATREQNLIHTEAVCLGRGLTDAILKCVAPLSPLGEKVDQSWCDLNGQPYRSDEFGYATTRVARHFVDAAEFTAPADCWGDVGAATAPLLILASLLSGLKAAKGPRQLVWTSSDAGERAAALLRLEPSKDGG